MKRIKDESYVKGSQSGILYRHIVKCITVFVVGVIVLIMFLMMNGVYSFVVTQQIKTTFYLSMFRNGSKNLSVAITSYVATGDEYYADEYYKELNEIQSRDIAADNLRKIKLHKLEIEELERIIALSYNLLPVEEKAIEYVKTGNLDKGIAEIFNTNYTETIKDISESTDTLTLEVVKRLEDEKNRMKVLQLLFEVIFVFCLFYLFITIVRTIRYARTEILHPVMKLSEQMLVMANGDLHTNLEIKEDESEVGKAATAIRLMKENWSDMIYELAYSLEEMSRGNYVLEFNTEYVGEFVTIKECLLEIVEGMRELISVISDVTKEVEGGAQGLAKASESLAEACTNQTMEVADIIIYLQGIAEATRNNEKDAIEAVKISNLARSTVDMEENRIRSLRKTLDEVTNCIEAMSMALEMVDMSDETEKLIVDTVNSLDLTMGETQKAFAELEEMRMGTEETTQRIERIVKNFEEEIENIDKIGESLAILGGVVDNNSATAEETAAISIQQKSQVENLVKLMNNFKI